jgi:uncharacterized membrane protein HdeD (DUF308 family)
MFVLAAAVVIIRDDSREAFLASAGWILVLAAAVEFTMAFRERAFPEGRTMAIAGAFTPGAGALLVLRPALGYLSLLQLGVVGLALRRAGSFVAGLLSRPRLVRAWGWIVARGVVDIVLVLILLAGLPVLIFFYMAVGWQAGAGSRLAAVLALSLIASGISLIAVASDQRRHALA